MPKDRATLDTAQVNFVYQWLQEHCNAECTLCKSRTLEVQLYLAELRTFRYGDLSLSDGVYPLVNILCTNCGNTILLSAMTLHLLEGKMEKESDDAN